ncbi:MAG: iron chelate uptake ABC transporter family permease subunit, partial [Oscillospiraceae bacterium]|nr:iron chelate uptake ABC transporter family permease subunit [Oscillospiraceae bacterium]
MRKANARLALFGGVLLFALLLGLLLGAANLHMAAVWGGDSTALHILRYVRLPRVLAAALAGAALSVAGVVI